MHSQFRLGRIRGIRIGIHYSWFVIALLLFSSLSDEYRGLRPNWSPALNAALAITTAALFFVSILLHELAHALTAQKRGIRVQQITLFALGGISGLEREPANPRDELAIAIVGPLTSFVIAGISLWASGAMRAFASSGAIAIMFGWLALINAALGLFNLLPAYPMDGGRVLRAIVWAIVKQETRATRFAANLSRIIAALFIGSGVLQILRGNAFQGLWMGLLGWYLMHSAVLSYRAVLVRHRGMPLQPLNAESSNA